MSNKANKTPKTAGKANQSEVIKKDELDALNSAAIGIYQGRTKYVTMLYQVMLASPTTISAHANYLADMDEKSGGGRSGSLLKTLRANLRYLATAHNLKAVPTVKSTEKDGPLALTHATPKPRKAGGKTNVSGGDGKTRDITLQDVCNTIAELCKGMKPETRVKVAEMVYRAAMGENDAEAPEETE